MKFLCKLFGHKWRYNFPSMPNKRICKRCYEKEETYELDNIYLFDGWIKVPYFENENRSDKELSGKWVKLPK